MRTWWGRLSLQARLAAAFGALAAGALVFLLAIVARTIGLDTLWQGKIVPATALVLVAFFIGGWLVAGWCLNEIARLGARIADMPGRPLPAELEGLAALLRREAQKRDRLLAELRRFTADASHQLRTPLTALRTVGEVALRQPADVGASREAIASMLEEAQRMNALIEQMLRLARMESDERVVQLRTVRLRQHLAVACDSVEVLAEEKNVRLELCCPEELDATADVALLLQAAVNLLDNAIRHSPAGGVVRVSARRDLAETVIEVSDQGPGISPEYHERIFHRFFRIESAPGGSTGGAGLGLCIAKTAIERMNGRITVESAPGHGAAFRVHLPGQPE